MASERGGKGASLAEVEQFFVVVDIMLCSFEEVRSLFGFKYLESVLTYPLHDSPVRAIVQGPGLFYCTAIARSDVRC